jgi:hypothetical protein
MAGETKPRLRFARCIHGRSSLLIPLASAYSLLTACSRVPKELISRFVKLCPTCQVRRGSARASPPDSDRDCYMHTRSPGLISPPQSRRESIATRKSSLGMQSPVALVGGTSEFQRQNRWMTPAQPGQSSTYNTLPTSNSMSVIASSTNAHGPNANHMNFNTSEHTNNHAAYHSNGLRFAHTPQSSFSYQAMKQEGHY